MKRLSLLFLSIGGLAACGPGSSSGECGDNLVPGDLVITEVFADAKAPPGGSGTDDGKEWFEIYNNSDRPVELKGMVVTHSRPDGSRSKSHTMRAVTVAPGQYFTLGNSADDLLAPYIDYGYAADLGDMFNSDGGKLSIKCGSQEVDAATYEMVKEGASRQFTAAQPPDYTLNDDPANWCEASDTEFEVGNFGTPGTDNDCTPIIVGQCSDGGTMRDTVPPTVGDLVITEVMPNPDVVNDNVGEWFEVYANAAVDLNGVGLDRAGDTAAPRVIESQSCVHLAAGEYGVFARSADMAANGGLPAAAVKGTFTFTLVDGTVAAPGDVRIMLGEEVLDAVTWTRTAAGKSHQLDPDRYDITANDDPTNFCDATTPYSTDNMGTPGAANVNCPVQAGPGQCIANGSARAIVKPAVGQLVITEFMANPFGTGTDATQEWFEVYNSGTTAFDLNGLGIKGNGATPSVPSFNECRSIAPGAYGLFAHNADPAANGDLPAVDVTFPSSIALAQTNGSLSVLDGTVVIDVITWGTGIVDGVSKQLNPGMLNATANDTPANFCNGTSAYGSVPENLGTPKAANVCP